MDVLGIPDPILPSGPRPLKSSLRDAEPQKNRSLRLIIETRTTTVARAPFLGTRYGGYFHRDVPAEDGELKHVGPGTPCGEYMRRFWQPICFPDELHDLPLRVKILGEDLVVSRSFSGDVGRLYAYQGHGHPRRRERLSSRNRGVSVSAPKIQDVQVIGVPDPRYGEELCAWIRLRDGEVASTEEIRSFCQGQIAHYKIPRYVKFVDGFPMTVIGKIQKFLMRQQMIDELGLGLQGTA